MARAVLAIQASSTASERDFSAAGVTLESSRSSMNPEHVNELVVEASSKMNFYRPLSLEISLSYQTNFSHMRK